jgi:hypothetical protein
MEISSQMFIIENVAVKFAFFCAVGHSMKSLGKIKDTVSPDQCCGSGSGIWYLFAPPDPGSGIVFFWIPDPAITSESLKHFFYFE